ncbi:MAG: hypothetical protein NZ740_10635 [Kiritimatiellae bacterium]|nr:hypothetical protein [Kiritimatiellia bacterium]MDW8459542.1 hypothetical protein [Verrucomicrobiota bacterium]
MLSLVTASIVSVRRLMQSGILGAIAAAAILGLLLLGIRQAIRLPPAASDRAFLIGWAAVASFFRLLIWLATPDYEQTGDCEYMLDAIRLLAREGFGEETMLQLAARYYDDYLWVGRSLPFLYPLAKFWPGQEVATARALNLVLSLVHNGMVFGLARRLYGRQAARVAYAVVSLIPIHSWLILDYTHQYLGAFLVLAGVYLLARAADGNAAPVVWLCDGWLLGTILSALHLQSGIDKFMLVVSVVAVFFGGLGWGVRDLRFARLGVMLGAAMLLYAPFSLWFSGWLNQYRPYRMSSHPISFTARGWNVATWGEYYGVYEQIDRETPWPEKQAAMKSLILSQIAYEPAKTLIALPLLKAAKFFLVGYATAIEQQLEQAGYGALRQVFRGMRVAFAPAFLALVAVGLWKRARSPTAIPEHLLVAAVPLLFCAIYVAVGETSPRYSFHVQGILAILAAAAWSCGKPSLSVRSTIRLFGAWWSLVLLIQGLAALVMPRIIRALAEDQLYVNVRVLRQGGGRMESAEPTVFTETISCQDGLHATGSSFRPPAGATRVTLFLWPLDRASLAGARIRLLQGDRVVWEREADGLSRVVRVAVPLASWGSPPLMIEIIDGTCLSTSPLLRWGYARFER